MAVQKDYAKITRTGREWHPRQPIKRINPNMGWDTETDINGDIYLIAHSDTSRSWDNFLLFPSTYDVIALLSERRFSRTNNFWWNVKFDTNAIVKMLPHENIVELLETNRSDYEDFKLTFFPHKMLRVSSEGFVCTYFDLAQFYNFQSLKSLAHRTSFKEKYDIEDIGNIDLTRIKNDVEYKKRIVYRCFSDAAICKELADQFTAKVREVVPVNLYLSPASLSKQYFLTNLKRVYFPANIPEVMEVALKAYHGGFIDMLQLGTFYNVYTVDINSAYPYIMSNLFSCEGTYANDTNYRVDAAYSFFHVIIDYEDDKISPLFFEAKKDEIYHANGKHDVWITGIEYDWLIRNSFDFKVIEGRHLLKTPDTYKPFKDKINWLFDKRLQAKDDEDEIEKTYKLILNAAYGSTISTNRTVKQLFPNDQGRAFKEWQRRGSDPYKNQTLDNEERYYDVSFKTSVMFNPLFASYITAGTRVQLLDAVFKHGERVISFNTDAVYLTKRLRVKVNEKLGNWSEEKIPILNTFGSGRFIASDNDGNMLLNKSKFRGVKGRSDIAKERELNQKRRVSNIEIINEQLKANQNGLGTPLNVTRVKGLKESNKNGNIADTCVFNKEVYQIGFNLNRRLWDREIVSNKEFFEGNIGSKPLTVNQIIDAC